MPTLTSSIPTATSPRSAVTQKPSPKCRKPSPSIPSPLPSNLSSAALFIWARQYDQAIAQFGKCNEIFPGFALNHERLAQLLAFLGKFEDAIAEETQARLLAGEDENSALQKEAALRHAWTSGGSQAYRKQLLDFTQLPVNPPEAYNSPFATAILYAQLDEKSKALDSLEKAFDQRSLSITELAIEPSFDSIRPDLRFQTLLRRMGLEKTIVQH